MKQVRVGGLRLLLCVIAWPLLTAALGGLTLLGLHAAARDWSRGHLADVGAIVLVEAYVSLLLALATCFGGPRGLAERLGFRLRSPRQLYWSAAGWVTVLTLGGGLTALFARLTRQPPQSNAVDVLKISFDPLFVVLVVPTVAVLAPVCEELLFRGALFGWLRGRVPLTAAVAASAAVFAGAHLILPLFPYLFVFGVVAAALYQRTGSTVVTFVMHAGQNTVAVAAAYYTIANGGAR